jgi:hypothetical protein
VRGGLTCAVLVPAGKIALGKLAQALCTGRRLLQVDGGFDDCLTVARELSEHYPVTLVNSVNPDRIEGRRPPPSRSATRSAGPRTCTACRSATRATSPPTGRATPSTTGAGRGCSASRPPARRRS